MLQGRKKTESTQAMPSLRGSFMRAVGQSLKCNKLGSLLLASGLVTHNELAAALKEQQDTGEQLGKILVRHGAISAVQMYRKLAEQWCIKASTAGVALMLQMTPSAAHAEETQDGIRAQFQVAAATLNPSTWVPAAEPAASYPDLFGTREVRSDDITPFKKWTTVMTRFETQIKAQSASPQMMMWKAELQKLDGQTAYQKIVAVNSYINKIKYIEDNKNWKKTDYWATPVEFFSRGGDCEDFAIAKYASLRALGFSSDQLRIAIVQDTYKNIPHAVLIVYTGEGIYVLDNQEKKVVKAGGAGRYQPIFSINSTSWWLHKNPVS